MVTIKRIITALGNNKINNNLKSLGLDVVCSDVFYKEGILEYLEVDKMIDYIIINDNLEGNIETENLLEKIKQINNKIKVILISNRTIKSSNVFRKLEDNDFIQIKNIILNKNKIFNQKTIPINNFFNNETKEGEIITILGPNGIGKSVFSISFANSFENKKVLILDFDMFNNSMENLLGVKKNIKKEKEKNNNYINQDNINIDDFIIQTKSKIDLISGKDLLFKSKAKVSPRRVRNIINNLKNRYDLVLVDTSTECLLDYSKEILKICNYSIFISGANRLEIQKSQRLLQIYTTEWEIPKNKIKIIFNKWTSKSIDDEILRDIFKNYDILGKIKLNEYYDLAVNKNNTRKKQVQNDINKIRRKIIRKKIIRKKRKERREVWN